jgi:hypothetical protein
VGNSEWKDLEAFKSNSHVGLVIAIILFIGESKWTLQLKKL